jgi:hypothetical protein
VAAAFHHARAVRQLNKFSLYRSSAEFRGGDLSEHADVPTPGDLGDRYKRLMDQWVYETPDTAAGALAMAETGRLHHGG